MSMDKKLTSAVYAAVEKAYDHRCDIEDAADEILEIIKADREPVDKGPWKAGVNRSDKRTFIQSDDFTHDVRLYVDGDFADQDEKLAYALGIADQLNAAPKPAEPVKVLSEADAKHVQDFINCDGMGAVIVEGPQYSAVVRALLARYGNTQQEQP